LTTLPSDTLFAQQWYLRNTISGEFDLNVADVWDDYTGKGIKVVVMDDGFEHTHPDLSPNYDTTLDYDYGQDDDDAAPFYTTGGRDNHGTAVMGIIGAASNGTGIVGVAYGSTLIGARIDYGVDADTWTANYVAALTDAMNNGASVVNMSFGGSSDFDTYTGTANLIRETDAIADVLANGRDGLGLILVKSAGNSRGAQTDVNHNQTDNHSGSIIVAAIDRDGYVSEYSSYGSAILVSAFGSPYAGEIVTTDRFGSAGYNASGDSDYTFKFNGTSAAAPMVSGIAALVLDANSALGWRDMQTILASTARHVGSAVDGVTRTDFEQNSWDFNGATKWNGGGMHFSRDYGYGLVDAFAAVRLAESWTASATSLNEKKATLDLLDATQVIPDGDLAGITFTGSMTGKIEVERVTVTLGLNAVYTEDLDIYLIGPDGKKLLLAQDQSDNWSDYYNGTFTYHSQAFRGMEANGEWSVQIVDDASGGAISVSDVKIEVFGSASGKKDTYIYTDEFSRYLDTHSTVLRDSDGGNDTLNAAAMTSAISINLARSKGAIDGTKISILNIENVYGGAGEDVIRGSKGANDIAGGRGADKLTGHKGADDFVYWHIKDSKTDAFDIITDFGRGRDRIDLKRIDADIATDLVDTFSFIGKRAFSGSAGELHYYKAAGRTYVEGDVDGDGLADFMIALNGRHDLVRAEFIL
jgi:subtilisin-like proprotein convertase family protein